jgi:hypothetical protein
MRKEFSSMSEQPYIFDLKDKLGYDYLIHLDGHSVSHKQPPAESPKESLVNAKDKEIRLQLWMDPKQAEELTEKRSVSFVITEDNDQNGAYQVIGEVITNRKIETAPNGPASRMPKEPQNVRNRLKGSQKTSKDLWELVIRVKDVIKIQ